MDRFDGVVVVTTNLFENYDPALLRQLLYSTIRSEAILFLKMSRIFEFSYLTEH